MEIHGQRVAECDGRDPLPVPLAHDESGAVRRIGVEVHTVAVAEFPHALRIVDGAEVGGTEGRNRAERDETCGDILLEHPSEGIHIDPASVVHGDLPYGGVSHTEYVAGLVHGEVGDLRCVDAELGVLRGETVHLHVPTEPLRAEPVPGGDDGRDVGLGSSGCEASVRGVFWESEQPDEPVDHALLELRRGGTLVPAVHAVVEAGYDQFRADGLGEYRRVEMGHVLGGPGAQEVREDIPLHILEHGLESLSLLGEESEGVHLLPELVGVDPGECTVIRERSEDRGEGLVDHLGESLLNLLGFRQEQGVIRGHPHPPL